MAEKEYIERGAVIEEIESLSVTVTGLRAGKGVLAEYAKQYKDSVTKILANAPAADVVEVVHARWILHGNDDDLGSTYWCSHCYFQVDEELFYPHGYDEEKPYNYCPHCGARMDGERYAKKTD